MVGSAGGRTVRPTVRETIHTIVFCNTASAGQYLILAEASQVRVHGVRVLSTSLKSFFFYSNWNPWSDITYATSLLSSLNVTSSSVFFEPADFQRSFRLLITWFSLFPQPDQVSRLNWDGLSLRIFFTVRPNDCIVGLNLSIRRMYCRLAAACEHFSQLWWCSYTKYRSTRAISASQLSSAFIWCLPAW